MEKIKISENEPFPLPLLKSNLLLKSVDNIKTTPSAA